MVTVQMRELIDTQTSLKDHRRMLRFLHKADPSPCLHDQLRTTQMQIDQVQVAVKWMWCEAVCSQFGPEKRDVA